MKLDKLNTFEGTQDVFFYIPDIRGFTKFLNHTDIHTSSRIIKALLETIMDSNILNMKVAEILGDAIVFYLTGPPPSITKLEAQAKKTFLDFQKVLQRLITIYNMPDLYELSLKIIVHTGPVCITEINGIPKLFGNDVILAYRLLKNNIKEMEYLLMTENYLNTQHKKMLPHSFQWSEVKEGDKELDFIGKVPYHYVSLSPLKQLIHHYSKVKASE